MGYTNIGLFPIILTVYTYCKRSSIKLLARGWYTILRHKLRLSESGFSELKDEKEFPTNHIKE